MISITGITISRYRSILNLKIDIDSTHNLIAICGENNVGKTNTLRAIDLFFNPDNYDSSVDRPTLKQAQGGASIDPKISIEFYNSKDSDFYLVTRDFKQYEFKANDGLSGEKYKKSSTGKSKNSASKESMDKKEVTELLNKFQFRYIESININIPQIVEQLTDDIIDVEYEGTRMTESKKALKEAYQNYTNGLQNILNVFSQSITGTFNNFKSNWNISFVVPKSVDTFRDLISDDVELYIDDKGCNSVEQKGSGLQRLAVILLNFEILKRLKKKSNIIVCVDEPENYLHEGLQKKLMSFFEISSSSMQIFYTTHSKIFINPYSMKNVILLGNNIYEQYSSRKKKNINVSETVLIDTDLDDGYEKICEHLGIEKNTYNILEKYNILVEGGCDKKYLEELGAYFGVELPKIIPINGVDNCESFLRFYESYYTNNNSNYKPVVKVLFDNDVAGRKVNEKIKKNIEKQCYSHIEVKVITVHNFNGENPDFSGTNHEIEDLLYPDMLCYLVNEFLSKMGLKKIPTQNFLTKITMESFSSSGALALLDHEKNDANPQNGNKISFTSSSNATNNFKNSIADMFNILGERKLIALMDECRVKYPFVETYITELLKFDDN